MNLRPLTVSVLDNFKNINSKIIFNRGGDGFLSLANDEKSIIAFFDLSEEERKIPEHGIYDLSSLLGIFKEMKSSEGFEIDYKEKYLLLKTKNSQVKYYYSPIDLLPKAPSKNNIDGKILFSLTLKNSDIDKLQTMSNLMGMENIQLNVKEKNAIATIKNINNETSNNFKLILGKCDYPDCEPVTWAISAWKMMDSVNYNLSLIELGEGKRISKFEAIDADNKKIGLLYYVAVLAV